MSQEIKTVTWDGKPITGYIDSLVGEVVKINRSVTTQTNVTGGGGSVRTSGGSNAYTHPLYAGLDKPKTNVKFNPVNVTSKNTLHDDVYLVDKDGKEHFIQFTDRPELGIREGHQIQLLTINATVAGKQLTAPYVAIQNKTLDKVFYDYKAFAPIQVYQASQVKLAIRYFKKLPIIKKILLSAYYCLIIMFIIIPPIAAIIALPLIFIIIKNAKAFGKKFEDLFDTDVKPALKKALI